MSDYWEDLRGLHDARGRAVGGLSASRWVVAVGFYTWLNRSRPSCVRPAPKIRYLTRATLKTRALVSIRRV